MAKNCTIKVYTRRLWSITQMHRLTERAPMSVFLLNKKKIRQRYYSTSERWQALSLLYTALLWHRTSGFAVSPEERQHLFAFYDKQGVLMIYSHPDPKGLAIWSFKTQNKYGQWWAITFNGSRALVRDTRVFSRNIIFVQYHSSIALLLINLRDEYMYK